MHDGFVKFAAAVPELILADPAHNAKVIVENIRTASENGVSVLVFPELCITGASCGVLFNQKVLIDAAEKALAYICSETADLDILIFLGLPVKCYASVYNCVAAIRCGRILGITPKVNLRTDADAAFSVPDFDLRIISIADQETPLGTHLVYCHEQIPELRIAAEVGYDAFAPINPGAVACLHGGATVVVNCAALPERAGENARRVAMLNAFTQRFSCGYVLSGAGRYESTTDDVYSGNCLIAENGNILSKCIPHSQENMIISEIDVHAISAARLDSGVFSSVTDAFEEIYFDSQICETPLSREISRDPFLAATGLSTEDAADEILDIQANGLIRRMRHTHAKCAVIGISGGLDSTLALLATVCAFDRMQRPRSEIICVTMPCFGTSARTKDNAVLLCERLGCELRCISIADAVMLHFRDIGHDPENTDVTYENAQARERTQILMDIANREGGLVIGTGDLSELALGFATYNGDHMSMYGLNATVPKSMIRHIVSVYADRQSDAELSRVLREILDTPISPELLPPVMGDIAQKTEEILGDYILQDFFIYHALVSRFAPKKVYRLARSAFAGEYTDAVIADKLRLFYRRFFSQQFKRSCLPDGPATGVISFSPRGKFLMPSDASASLWLSELENI